MRFEYFTARARTVLCLASEEATRAGHDSVDTIHILIGLLQEKKGIAWAALAERKLGVKVVRDAHESYLIRPDVSLAELESRCHTEARWFDHHYPGIEHLLLGLCSLSDCRAARLLTDLAVPPVELCHFIVDVLGHFNEWPQWLKDHPQFT
jgi:ATP-dependent Clp protease ATP-binding subunit ClpC